MKTRWMRIFRWIALGVILSPLTYGQHQLIKNGDFAQVLHGWGINPALRAELPYLAANQAVDMAPSLPNWEEFKNGPVVFQPLNVGVAPGTELNVAISLLRKYSYVPAGSTVAVYLEYINMDGERVRERILHVSNEDVDEGVWRPFSVQHFVPSGMMRLVALSLDREGEGWFEARNVSLLSPVTGGALPEMGQIAPSAVAYGETFSIQGKNFGTDQGVLKVGGTTAGVEILSWTSTLIQARLNDPSFGGELLVETAQGVRIWQKRYLQVSSSYYRAYASSTAADMNPFPLAAMPGQTVEAGIFLRFFNGYAPPTGIVLSLPDETINGTFSYEDVTAPGGSVVSIDTTGWAPGTYSVEVEADDGVLLPRRVLVPIIVRDVQDVHILYQDTTSHDYEPLAGATFTRQRTVNFYLNYYDADDNLINDLYFAPITVTSSHPFAIEPFVDIGPWGTMQLLVNDSVADAQISVNLPDGQQFSATVSVSIPSEPRITGAGFLMNPMNNFPGYELDSQENENVFSWSGSNTFSRRSAGWSWGFIADHVQGSGSMGSIDFFAADDLQPGRYLWTGGGTVDGVDVYVGRVLTVVNDPNTGLISGKAVQFGGGVGHGVYGTLELYDATTGDLVEERDIMEGGSLDRYTASRVEPGSYRLRWIPDDWTGLMLPQWYPNAGSFADAETVVVTAGSQRLDIDFLCVPVNLALTAPAFRGPPSYDLEEGRFSVTIIAEDNVEYVLEKSVTMMENTWIQVGSTTGWDGNATLIDGSASGSRAFYRVRRQ